MTSSLAFYHSPLQFCLNHFKLKSPIQFAACNLGSRLFPSEGCQINHVLTAETCEYHAVFEDGEEDVRVENDKAQSHKYLSRKEELDAIY